MERHEQRGRARATVVPTAVAGPAFRVQEALAAGYSRYACEPARMIVPTKSVRALEPLDGLSQWAAAFALALPDDVVFSHLTAAHLHGLPLPSRLSTERGLHVMRDTTRPRIERQRVVHHKGLEHRDIVTSDGMPVTSIADTWLDIIAAYHHQLSLPDIVMMGDAAVELLQPTKLIHDKHPEADPSSADWWSDPVTTGCQELRTALLRRPPFRGSRRAREALRFIRPRVWSPSESYARMVVVEGELPEPALNKDVHWENGSGLIGNVDLYWRSRRFRNKVAGEYQGEEKYRNGASRTSDNDKRLLLEDDGWLVIELFSKDIHTSGGRHRFRTRIADWLGVR